MGNITAEALVDMIRDPKIDRDSAIRLTNMAMTEARRQIRNKAEKLVGDLRTQLSNLSLEDPEKPQVWVHAQLGSVQVGRVYRQNGVLYQKLGETSSIQLRDDGTTTVGHAQTDDPFDTVEVSG